MGVPSVTKIKRGNVEFVSSVDRANYYIEELTRRAMLDVGRLVSYECSKRVRQINKYLRKRKRVAARYGYKIPRGETTLHVGVERKDFGAVSAWWADQAELGTHNQPKRGILRSSVYDNLDKIREIEAHYLSAIEDDLKAERMIDERELQEAAAE